MNSSSKHFVFCTFTKQTNTFVASSEITTAISLPSASYFPSAFVFTDKTSQSTCSNVTSSDDCSFTLTFPVELTSMTINTTSQLTYNQANTPLSAAISFAAASTDGIFFQYYLTANTSLASFSSTYQVGFVATKSVFSFFSVSDTSSNTIVASIDKILYSDIKVYPYVSDCSNPYSTTCTMVYAIDSIIPTTSYLHFEFDSTVLSSSTAITPIFACPSSIPATSVESDVLSDTSYNFYCQVWQKVVRYFNETNADSYTNGQVSYYGQYVPTSTVDVYYNSSAIINYYAPLEIISNSDCSNDASPYCTMTFIAGNYYGPKSYLSLNQLPYSQTIAQTTCSNGITWSTYYKRFTLTNTISSTRTIEMSSTTTPYSFNAIYCDLIFIIDPSLTYTVAQRQIMFNTLTTVKTLQSTSLTQINTTLVEPSFVPTAEVNYNYTQCADEWSYLCTIQIAIQYTAGAPLTQIAFYLPGATSNYGGVWDPIVTFSNINTGYADPSISVVSRNSLGAFEVDWGIYQTVSTDTLYLNTSEPILITISYRLEVNFANTEFIYPQLAGTGGVWLDTPLNITNVNTDTDLEGNELNGVAPNLVITFDPALQVTAGDDCADVTSRICTFTASFSASNPIAEFIFTADGNAVYGLTSTTADWQSSDLFNNVLSFDQSVTDHIIRVHKPYNVANWTLVMTAESAIGADGTQYYFSPNWELTLPLVWTTEATPSFVGCDDPSYPYCDVTYDIVNTYYPGQNWYPLIDGPVIIHQFPDSSAINTTNNTFVMLDCQDLVGYGVGISMDFGTPLFALASYSLDPSVDDTVPPASCTVRWQKISGKNAAPSALPIWMMGIVPLFYEYIPEIGPVYDYVHWPSTVYKPVTMTLRDNCFTSLSTMAYCTMEIMAPASTLSPLAALSASINSIPGNFPFESNEVYSCTSTSGQTIASFYVEQSAQTQNQPLLLVLYPSGVQTTTQICTVTFIKSVSAPVMTTAFDLPFIRYQSIPSVYSLVAPTAPNLPSDDESDSTASAELTAYQTFVATTQTITDASVSFPSVVAGGIVNTLLSVSKYNSSQNIPIVFVFSLPYVHTMTAHVNYNLQSNVYQCVSNSGELIATVTSTKQKTTLLTFIDANGSQANQNCTVTLPHNNIYPAYTSNNVTHDFTITSPSVGTTSTYHGYATYPYYVSTAQITLSSS